MNFWLLIFKMNSIKIRAFYFLFWIIKMISKIEKVTLFVNSQEEAKKFWIEKLGFILTEEQMMGPDIVWIEVTPKNAQTALVLYPKAAMLSQKPEMVSHPNIIFSSDNIEDLHSHLSKNNVEVDYILSMPWGKMFNFKDPDGNSYMVRG